LRVLKRSQTLAVFLTVAIIGALLFIPQVSAITVGVSITPTTITRGESATVSITVNIGYGENIPIQQIKVIVDNRETIIIPPSPAGYGYGYGYLFGYGYSYPIGGYGYGYGYPYGYGYGFAGPTTLQYTVTLYTGGLSEGSHDLRVDVVTGLQPTGVFSSQTIRFIVAPPPAPPAPPTPPPAPPAVELEALPPEERATKLLQMSTEDAARRVEEMSVDKAAEAIRVMNATAAANILNLVNTTRIAEILTTLPLNHSAQITLELKVDRAAGAILTMNVTNAAQLIQTTVTINVTRTAQLVDHMVAVNVNRAAAIVEQLPTETLVNLLVEIAGLPSTPEKAAKLIDAMSLSKAVDAVRTLIGVNRLQTLAQILTHVSTPRLNDIFKQLTSAERLAALPYLDASTLARLKHVKASLTSDRVEAQPGSSVKVSVVLSATQPITEGAVVFNVPPAFKTKALSVEGLPAAVSRVDGRLLVNKSAAQPSYSTATVTFDLVVPLNASVSVGQIISLAVSVDVPDFAVSFDTPTTISVKVVKPTVQSIFSALNSYFDKTVSGYTEGRVPVKQDIYALLDFYFRGRVD
jgi:flagellar motility protein MotE (MotC chaperone)